MIAQRTRHLFDPKSKEPFKLSRSRIDRFIKCPCCFYLDRRLGVDQVSGPAFTLNSATDTLLKKEFDVCRAKGKPHPLMMKYKVNAVPFQHANIDVWRENFKGVQALHAPTGLLITGAIDDLWKDTKGEYIVVDYKSTSKNEEIIVLDKAWQDGYKRQMEIYQWLLRRNGLKVSDTGYFVYCNGNTNLEKFDGKLEFDLTLIPYKGDDKWIDGILFEIHKCLNSDKVPEPGDDCDFCAYREAVADATGKKVTL